jgi:hypothetical protein
MPRLPARSTRNKFRDLGSDIRCSLELCAVMNRGATKNSGRRNHVGRVVGLDGFEVKPLSRGATGSIRSRAAADAGCCSTAGACRSRSRSDRWCGYATCRSRCALPTWLVQAPWRRTSRRPRSPRSMLARPSCSAIRSRRRRTVGARPPRSRQPAAPVQVQRSHVKNGDSFPRLTPCRSGGHVPYGGVGRDRTESSGVPTEARAL